MHGDHHTIAPVPMRQNMRRRNVRTPFRLVQPITVLRESAKVENSEVGTSGRTAPWVWFAEVVEPGPDKLPENVRIRILRGELDIGDAVVRMHGAQIP